MAVRRWHLALGVAATVFMQIGPAPADITGLFEHPPAACLQSQGCGHTDAWWDRPVLVAHAAELATPPHLQHASADARR
jgi:hypothetical protein